MSNNKVEFITTERRCAHIPSGRDLVAVAIANGDMTEEDAINLRKEIQREINELCSTQLLRLLWPTSSPDFFTGLKTPTVQMACPSWAS